MNRLSKILNNSAAIAVSVLICTSAARAQLPESDHAKMDKEREARFSQIVDQLGLTPEQKQSMTQQRAAERGRSQDLRQRTKAVRDQITRELDMENTDTAKVDSLVAQLKELTGQRIEHQIGEILALKKILSPEQFRKLNEMREKDRKERYKGGRK